MSFTLNSRKQSHNLYDLRQISKKFIIVSAMLCLFLIAPMEQVTASQSPLNRMQSSAAQQKTIRALQAINQNQWSIGREFMAGARDPLASKLYYWLSFSKQRDVSNYARLTQFIRRNPQWPDLSILRRKAEEKMPASLGAQNVVAWFGEYPPKTATGIDRYITALKITGQETKAKKILEDWWASNSLSRKDQRRLFRKYKKDLSMTAHKRRFDHVLFKKHYGNAIAIAGMLKRGYPELVAARMALAKESKGASALIAKVPAHLQNDPGLLYERLRWRRRNHLDVDAMKILHQMPRAENIQNLDKWWRERHIIIRRLIEKKHWKSAYLLASAHKQKSGFAFAQAQWLSGWLALRFVNKPVKAYQHFDKLYRGVHSPVSKARGAYWAGRASAGFADKTISQRWYKVAAQTQTVFYGQMAAAELGIAQSLPNAAPPKISQEERQAFKRHELIQAAFLFQKAGMRKEAERFLKAFVAHKKTPKAYYFAAKSAAEAGLIHQAVRLSKQATREGMFLTAQSYPVITKYLHNIDLEWSLIHGIIRQESMFDAKAQSPAGALGLMQLMPATAREVAGKLKTTHSRRRLTTDPRYNIQLGSRYLSDMIRRFNGSYPMAIAAYNAGPGRVDKWIKTFGDPRTSAVDLLDWIEMIPIYETRNYVQRVMEVTYVYRLRLRSIQTPPSTPLHIALISSRK